MEALSTPSITLPTESSLKECNPRLAQYKSKNLPNQEERRQSLLEQQKKNRDESFNASRGLIEELVTSEQDAMEWTSSKFKPRIQKLYTNRLMFSEWLKQVPGDLSQVWYLVPCPVGRRALVVASGGETRSYTKAGIQTATFNSALPGGNPEESKGCTILDCIWSRYNHAYYILDVLAWSNQPMLDCETEFRFFWLKSKLGEMPSLSEKSDDNPYPFILLEYHSCDQSVMTNVMAIEHLFGENGNLHSMDYCSIILKHIIYQEALHLLVG
ncbi:hypothetical protein L9F63_006692 [Diploptera punctata]|uniref:Snurportin-1 n=1 Tax=Diploptera punctata TaxID=6984 RepID=A0AAD8E4G7_DIPPU|nr:hypothetical protein L9F63_006692 [Diploptera punctata]